MRQRYAKQPCNDATETASHCAAKCHGHRKGATAVEAIDVRAIGVRAHNEVGVAVAVQVAGTCDGIAKPLERAGWGHQRQVRGGAESTRAAEEEIGRVARG